MGGEGTSGTALRHRDCDWSEFEDGEQRLFARHRILATPRWIDVPELDLHVRVLEAGDGPPLVLLPGGGVPAASFAPLMANLRGWRISAIDRPGWGPSPEFRYPRSGFRRFGTAFLSGVLTALGIDRALIAAASIGATWALWLAVDDPARVAAVVSLGCPAFLLGTGVHPSIRTLVKDGTTDQWLVRHDDIRPSGLLDVLVRAAGTPGFLESRDDLISSTIEALERGEDLDLDRDVLRRVAVPVSFCWGDRDPYAGPDLAAEACRVMARGHFTVVPGGHYPWLQSPDSCARALVDLTARIRGEEDG